MYKWILPSIGEVLATYTSTQGRWLQTSVTMLEQEKGETVTDTDLSAKAEYQWRISIAAIEKLLLNYLPLTSNYRKHGFVFVTPAPVFSHPLITEQLETITFSNQGFNRLALMPFSTSHDTCIPSPDSTIPSERVLPLLPVDPITQECFCLVLTEEFSVVLVLTDNPKTGKEFQFSFDPDVVNQVWQALAGRVKLVNPNWCDKLDHLIQPYLELEPDYRIVSQFSQLLLSQIPHHSSENIHPQRPESQISNTPQESLRDRTPPSRIDAELLQAFAHEVRTPLATIRTLASLILRQKDLPANLIKRIQMIERECLEQIDRMELLFRAAELETSTNTKNPSTHLTPMCLEQVLQQSIPRWQQFATRRNLTLDVVLPQKLPTVVSNPNMLDRMLTGLIENFTRSLPSGSHIQVQVIPAGDQLKLQLLPLPQSDTDTSQNNTTPPLRKAIGELLMFQPETGTISLNLTATKHLFQAIGGKLIVRQRPQYGEVLTIFLPLEGVDHPQSVAG
ncbi:sensor histidine kinase [Calothrix sp. NIES-3974]|uniref:sensor histidine kinase n=1 Tax=Calothrix sp. NIES-3974 TaxID=2005462 RepID=UPI000B60E885|nr:HAMP domain-containing sensor histidine kinase [Calothrix sp. NIES-3974]BAZ05299.1 histidine kinase [Calothrix sp. NIES-3974]